MMVAITVQRDDGPSTGTRTATRASGNDPSHDVFVQVYERLKSIASRQLRRYGAVTLDTTGLVHELYERMAEQLRRDGSYPRHFIGYAASAMRNILADRARHHLAQKSGGTWTRISISDPIGETLVDQADRVAADVVSLDDSLRRLAAEDARAARVVELRYFAGMSLEQVARHLGLNRRTITRDWQFARAYLRALLAD